MDIQCAAVVVCVREGSAWPREAGERRVSVGYVRGALPTAPDARTGAVSWLEKPVEESAAALVNTIADRHRGEAAVVFLTPEELAELGVPSGTALAVDSEGFVVLR